MTDFYVRAKHLAGHFIEANIVSRRGTTVCWYCVGILLVARHPGYDLCTIFDARTRRSVTELLPIDQALGVTRLVRAGPDALHQ